MTRAQSVRAIAFALLAGGLVAACETDRSTAFDPVGVAAYNFNVVPGGANLPSGSAAVGGGAVTLTMSGLRALSTGQYQFWVMGRDSQNLDVPVQAYGAVMEFFLYADGTDPVTGDTLFSTDSTEISAVSVAGYSGSDAPLVTNVRVTIDSVADGSDPTTYHAVFVSLESSPASTPGTARFLWRRIGVGGGGSMLFGNFGGSDVINLTSPNDYVYGARGSGLGGARGPELSVDLQEVARPPVGFYYRGYIVDETGAGVVVDTARSAWSRDSTVSRVSLYDADVNDLLPDLVGGEIRHMQIRNCASGAAVTGCQNTMNLPAEGTFVGQVSFQLKLEPKGGVAASPKKSISHAGGLPGIVTQ